MTKRKENPCKTGRPKGREEFKIAPEDITRRKVGSSWISMPRLRFMEEEEDSELNEGEEKKQEYTPPD